MYATTVPNQYYQPAVDAIAETKHIVNLLTKNPESYEKLLPSLLKLCSDNLNNEYMLIGIIEAIFVLVCI